MIEIKDTETNARTTIERAEFVQILNAAACHNIDDIERIEKVTFGDIIKDGKYVGLVDTQLANHLSNWEFCCARRDQIKAIEEELGLGLHG